MRIHVNLVLVISMVVCCIAEDVRLLDLEPTDAQQIIEKHDQNLDYAPKIESNVPAIRFLGEEPHHVLEDIYSARQYHGQDGVGGYLYGYNVPHIAKTEKKKPSGDLKGAYNYINGDGQEIKVQYWDNGTGFHQIDNVPQIAPKQVEDSPAVKEAKEKFLKRWHEEAERNSHPVPYPYSGNEYASAPVAPQHSQPIPQATGQYQSGGYQGGPGQQPQNQGGYNQGQYQGAASNQGQYQLAGQSHGGQGHQQPQNQYQGGYNQGNYQGAASNQGKGPHQGQNQYQVSNQGSGQYQAPGQGLYQGSIQYQGSGQHQGAGQFQGGQYQGGAKYQGQNANEIDYEGKSSDNQNVYASRQNPNNPQGEYKKEEDEEEVTGPPKGFFYEFNYPVGIIVNKGELVKSGEVKQIYDQNKAKFEAQLQGQAPSKSSQNGYIVV